VDTELNEVASVGLVTLLRGVDRVVFRMSAVAVATNFGFNSCALIHVSIPALDFLSGLRLRPMTCLATEVW